MMGRLAGDRERLFYAFELDAVVPPDHLVRRIDGVLDLSWLHGEPAPFYSHTGRPSIDPELIMRMPIVGYVFAICSERQLCAEAQVNLAYRWFCGLSIEDEIPDRSVFSRADFQYDQERDLYICPGGKELTTSGTAHDGTTFKYLAKRRDCARCPLKPSCTKGPERRLARDVDEPVRDYVRALAGTEAFKRSRDERKKVEMAFAHMKRIFKLDRLRLRGLNGARDEIPLTATAQSLRKLAKYVARPPPTLNPA